MENWYLFNWKKDECQYVKDFVKTNLNLNFLPYVILNRTIIIIRCLSNLQQNFDKSY